MSSPNGSRSGLFNPLTYADNGTGLSREDVSDIQRNKRTYEALNLVSPRIITGDDDPIKDRIAKDYPNYDLFYDKFKGVPYAYDEDSVLSPYLEDLKKFNSKVPSGYNKAPLDNISSIDDLKSGKLKELENFEGTANYTGYNTEAVNPEIAELEAELDKVNKEIQDLTADISYQKKLKALEYTNDPLWEQAKYEFIYHNDYSGLENILSRQSNEKIAKASKDQTKADTVDAWQSKINSYDWGIERLIARGKNNPANFTKEDVDNLNEIISNRRFAAAEKARAEGKKFNEAEFEMDLDAKGIDIDKLNSGSLQPWKTETIGNKDYINVDSEVTTALTNIDNIISSNESAKINSKIDDINATRQLIEGNGNISEAEKRAAISKLDEAMAKLERAKQTLEEGDKYTQLKSDYDIAVRKGKFSDQKRILDEMDKLEGHVDERKQLRTEYQERVKAWVADTPRRDKQKIADGILAKYRKGDIDQTTAENDLKALADDIFIVELSGFSEIDKNKAKATVKKR